ncbi:hypothetical protein D3C80_1999310 [compost metagenome]
MNTVPTVVAVHGVITANQRRDAPGAQFGKGIAKALQRGFCAAWRGIATVQEGVQVNGFGAALRSQFNHRQNMVFVAVDAAR